MKFASSPCPVPHVFPASSTEAGSRHPGPCASHAASACSYVCCPVESLRLVPFCVRSLKHLVAVSVSLRDPSMCLIIDAARGHPATNASVLPQTQGFTTCLRFGGCVVGAAGAPAAAAAAAAADGAVGAGVGSGEGGGTGGAGAGGAGTGAGTHESVAVADIVHFDV
eukprot:1188041-Prorocentrum_minimum.AAC.18